MKKPKDIKKELEEHDKYLGEAISEKDLEELKGRANRFAIDEDDLKEEVAKQGAVFAYYSYTAKTYRTLKAKAQMKLELISSRIKLKIRDADPRDGRKGGPTVSQIEAEIQNDRTYQEAFVELKNVEHTLELLEADVSASAMKAAMLRLYAADEQKEKTMKGRL